MKRFNKKISTFFVIWCSLIDVTLTESCVPTVRFINCKANSGNDNPMSNIEFDRDHVINIDVDKGCRSSTIRITWKLYDFETRELLKDLKEFKNALFVRIAARSLALRWYILEVTVKERAFGKNAGFGNAECWFKLVKPLHPARGYKLMRARDASEYKFKKILCLKNCPLTQRGGLSVLDVPMHFHVDVNPILDDVDRMESDAPVNATFKHKIYFRLAQSSAKVITNKTVGVMSSCQILQFDKFTTFENGKNFFDLEAYDSYYPKDKPKTLTNWLYHFVPRLHTGVKRYPETLCPPGTKMYHYICKWRILNFIQDAIYIRAKVRYKMKTGEEILVTVGGIDFDIHVDQYAELGFLDPLPLEFYFIFFTGYSLHNYNTKDVKHSEETWHFTEPLHGNTLKEKLKHAYRLYTKGCEVNMRTTYSMEFYMQKPRFHFNVIANYAHTFVIALCCTAGSVIDRGNVRLYFRFIQDMLSDLNTVIEGLEVIWDEDAPYADGFHDMEDFVVRVSAMLVRLELPDHIEPTPIFVAARSRLTNELCKAIHKAVWATRYPSPHQTVIETAFYTLRRCIHVNLGQMQKDAPTVTATTTVVTPVDFHMYIPEDYPDYGVGATLDSSSRDLAHYSTMAAINSSVLYMEAFLLTSTMGDELMAPELDLLVAKYFVFDAPQIRIDMTTVVIDNIQVYVSRPSDNNWDLTSFVKGMVLILKRPIFYYMELNDDVPFDFVMLRIVIQKYRIMGHVMPTTFHYPLEVMHRFPTNDSIKYVTHTISLPSTWQLWTDEEMNKHMFIIKIEASNNSVVALTIKNITGFPDDVTNKILQVSLLDTQYPSYPEHFKSSLDVNLYNFSEDQPLHYYRHIDSDCFVFLGILPVRPGVVTEPPKTEQPPTIQEQYQEDGISFSLAATLYQCNQLINDELQVNPNCWVPFSTDTLIRSSGDGVLCLCDTLFTVVPIIENVEQYEMNSTRINFSLDPIFQYPVCMIALIIFFLYCILMLLEIRRGKPIVNLCFASDNNKGDRYAYLIGVKTSSLQGSGTTSNVIIKLHGRKANSLPYVLNYPDPDLRLLQVGGDDYFVIATAEYLGELRYIELWTDVIGFDPSWRCENVRIFDLRRNKRWFFDVQTTFALRDNMESYHKTRAASKRMEKRRVLQIFQYFALHFGPYHTFNIFESAAQDIELGYLFRLTLMLSHILMALTLTVIFIAFPRLRYMDAFGVDYIMKFNNFLIWIVVIGLITSLPHYLLSFIYRNTAGYGLLKPKAGSLPRIVITVLWIILAVSITVSMVYLLIFGWWIAAVTLFSVLIMFLSVLLLDIIVLENIYISLYQIYRLQRRRHISKMYGIFNFGNIVLEIENQRRFLYRRISLWGIRPFLKHLYRPLSDALLKERREMDQLRQNLRGLMSKMILIFIIGMLFVIMEKIHIPSDTGFMGEHMEDMFINAKFVPSGIKAENVLSIEDFYLYLNNTIIPTSLSNHWYGKYRTPDGGLTVDFQTKLANVIRIRKLSVNPVVCEDEHVAKVFNVKECLPDWNRNRTDKTGHGLSTSMFNYQTRPVKHRYYPYLESSYEAGGFMTPLGRTLHNSYYMLKSINDSLWFLNDTRAFFIEFLTFNANTGLFTDIRILFERGPTKFIALTYRIISSKLRLLEPKVNVVYMVAFGLMLVLFIWLISVIISQIIKRGPRLFLSIWTVVEIGLVFCIISYCIMALQRHVDRDKLETTITNTQLNHYIETFHIMDLDEDMRILSAFIIFLCMLRLIQFFHFTVFFRHMEYTIAGMFRAITFIFFCTLWIYFAMAIIACVRFAPGTQHFSTISRAFFMQWLIFARLKPEPVDYLREERNFGRIYLFALIVISMIVKITIIIITIVVFKECKRSLSGVGSTYSLRTYFKESVDYYYQYIARSVIPVKNKTNLKAGGTIWYEEPISPKEIKYRYENVYKIGIDKMNLMRCVLLASLRNTVVRQGNKKISSKDFILMEEIARAVYVFRHPTSKDTGGIRDVNTLYSFGVRIPKKRALLINDTRLLEMEIVARECVTTPRLEQFKAITQERLVMVPDLLSLGRMESMFKCLVLITGLFGNITFDVDPKYDFKIEGVEEVAEPKVRDDDSSSTPSTSSVEEESDEG